MHAGAYAAGMTKRHSKPRLQSVPGLLLLFTFVCHVRVSRKVRKCRFLRTGLEEGPWGSLSRSCSYPFF